MQVPFLSSSAINREHYHLVQSIEAASTLQRIDDILVHKVDIVRKRFEKRLPGHVCSVVTSCTAFLLIDVVDSQNLMPH